MGQPLAPVVDINTQRARRGAQIGRGQTRRTLPGRRPPRAVLHDHVTPLEWEHALQADRETGTAAAATLPLIKRVRRSGQTVRNPKAAWPRRLRRLVWRLEYRTSKVAWPESAGARCEIPVMAPVVDIRTGRRVDVRKAA